MKELDYRGSGLVQYVYEMEVLLMADSTTGTVENLALVIANLSQSISKNKKEPKISVDELNPKS